MCPATARESANMRLLGRRFRVREAFLTKGAPNCLVFRKSASRRMAVVCSLGGYLGMQPDRDHPGSDVKANADAVQALLPSGYTRSNTMWREPDYRLLSQLHSNELPTQRYPQPASALDLIALLRFLRQCHQCLSPFIICGIAGSLLSMTISARSRGFTVAK